MQLAAIDTAHEIDDINLPGFNLHPLKSNRDGIWSITRSEERRVGKECRSRDAGSNGNVYTKSIYR
mgnify:CR=1 FL=1